MFYLTRYIKSPLDLLESLWSPKTSSFSSWGSPAWVMVEPSNLHLKLLGFTVLGWGWTLKPWALGVHRSRMGLNPQTLSSRGSSFCDRVEPKTSSFSVQLWRFIVLGPRLMVQISWTNIHTLLNSSACNQNRLRRELQKNVKTKTFRKIGGRRGTGRKGGGVVLGFLYIRIHFLL